MARLTEYPQAEKFDDGDILIKDGINGTKKITTEDAAKDLVGKVVKVVSSTEEGNKVFVVHGDEEIQLAKSEDLKNIDEIDSLKESVNNITNWKIYQPEVYNMRIYSGKISQSNTVRSVIIPVVTGRHYKIEAIGRGNRNQVFGISADSWEVGTEVVRLDYTPEISYTTDNITVEIEPTGYNYLFITFAYSTVTPFPYDFTPKVTEISSEQFSVNGIEAPTYEQFESIEKSVDDKYFHTEQNNLVYRKDITPNTTIAPSGELTDNGSFTTTGFIKVIPGHTYSISSRRRLAWYYADKSLLDYQAESESGPATVVAPQDAKYLRFAYGNGQTPMPMCNEGDVLLQFDETEHRLKPEYYAGAKRYRLETSTMSISSGPFSDTHNLAVLAGQRIDYKDGRPPRTLGYLLADPVTQKMYSADANLGSITYLCDWKNPLDTDWVPVDDPYRAELDSDDDPYMKNWIFNVTADGDILCMRKRGRRKPILYPHGDYDHPVMIDVSQTVTVWGGDYTLQGIRPASNVHSPLLVCFDDGDIIFGDYKIHSVTEYNNHEPRCIWKVTKPYTTPGNWTVPHAFNHATGNNSSTPTKHNQSTDPDNDIGHIHTTVYDWYSKLVYVTTGDYDEHCRVWVSSDFGDTWAEEASIAPEPTGNGQIYRSVSIVFTKDAMWYGTDSGPMTHKLIKVPRDANGVPDFDQLEIVAELERGGQTGGQAVYSNILTRDPPGILFLDRGQHRTDTKLQIPWYSFEDKKIYFIAELDAIPNTLSSLAASNGLCQDFYNMYQTPELDYQLIGGIGGKPPTNPNNIDILGNGDNLITNSSGKVTGIYNPVGLIRIRIVPELSVT